MSAGEPRSWRLKPRRRIDAAGHGLYMAAMIRSSNTLRSLTVAERRRRRRRDTARARARA